MDKDKLRQHPEYTELNLLGEDRGFLLTMYGVEVAQEKGVEVIPLIVDLTNRIAGIWTDEDAEGLEFGSEEMEKQLKHLIRNKDARALSVVVWWGLLTFDPDLEIEEVQMMLTPGTLIALIPQVITKAMDFASDQTDEDAEMAEMAEDGQGKD